MKNYYEVLRIGRDADAIQIKRAYFKLVREYPPERFPEEFKHLREAYDILMDEESRAEYDCGIDLPPEIKPLYDEATKMRNDGAPEKALGILLALQKVYPYIPLFKATLAHLYEEIDKYGKAIEVWTQLNEQTPGNAEYALGLARSYARRGWNKKAAAQYKIAVEIDPGNPEAWSGCVDSYCKLDDYETANDVCDEALVALKERKKVSLTVLALAFSLGLRNLDKEVAAEHLLGIRDALKSETRFYEKEPEMLFDLLFTIIRGTGSVSLLPYLKEIEALIPGLDEETHAQMRAIEIPIEIESLEDEGVPSIFIDLFEILHDGCECEDCLGDLMAVECNILSHMEAYRPHILRLKAAHPNLFKMHADFFREVLSSKNPNKLLYERLKPLSRKGFEPNLSLSETGGPQIVETVRRENFKTGRNDPCPCGSGKKYKKCCG